MQYIVACMATIKNDDLSLWLAFHAVGKRESFTQAARDLRLSVPVLSKKIAKLEELLSVRLFLRTTRRVVLTNEARDLFPQVEGLLQDARSIEALLEPKVELEGLIHLTCIPSLGQRHLSYSIVKFHRLHPLVKFRVHLSDAITDLVESQMDLAIRAQKPTESQHVYRKLISNNLVLCASPSYLQKYGQPSKIAELNNHKVLSLSAYEGCSFQGTSIKLKEFRKSQNIICENGYFLTELALQGAAIVVRSKWDVAGYLKSKKLVSVLEKFPLEPFGDIFAVTPHRKLLPPRVRTFLDFIQAEAQSWVG